MADRYAVWDGITQSKTLGNGVQERNSLADASKSYDWSRVFEILTANPMLINSTRPDGHAFYTPLHQAAHGGAASEVASRLIDLGAFRTIKDAHGKRPVDIAIEHGAEHLISILEPDIKWDIPTDIVHAIEVRFHKVILKRAKALVEEHRLRLPDLEPLLEFQHLRFYFPIPGMYGGFSYWLDDFSMSFRLIAESACRVVGGSAERHEVTKYRSKRVDVGFDYE